MATAEHFPLIQVVVSTPSDEDMATYTSGVAWQRIIFNDPIYRAMEMGYTRWGDLLLTDEELSRPLSPPSDLASDPVMSDPLISETDMKEDDNWIPVKKHSTKNSNSTTSYNAHDGIKTLIVRNLPRDITDYDLHNIFELYGPIKDIYIPKNMDKASPYYGTIKGFALIKFLSPQHSAAALHHLAGRLTLSSNHISIEFAKQDR